MIHQPSGGYSRERRQTSRSQQKRCCFIRERSQLDSYGETHRSEARSSASPEDADRDRFMSPKDAVDYGLIDQVLEGPVPRSNGKPADSDHE